MKHPISRHVTVTTMMHEVIGLNEDMRKQRTKGCHVKASIAF